MYWTNGYWSHVATSIGNGKIIHAISEGVVEEDLSNYFDNKSYLSIITPPDLDEIKKEKMLTFLKSIVGSKYAWGKALWLGFLIINNQACGYRIRLSIDFIIFPFLILMYCTSSNILILLYTCIIVCHLLSIFNGYYKKQNSLSL